MRTCENHESTVVVFVGSECPLCEALRVMDCMADTISSHEGEIDSNEKQIGELESSIGDSEAEIAERKARESEEE